MSESETAPTSDSQPDYNVIWREVYGDMQSAGPVHRHLRRMVRRILNSLDYKTVLDVGCGPGHNLALLANDRTDVTFGGIDIADEVVQRARARYPGDFSVLDIESGHLDGQWDLVYCSLVLEHLRDDVAALRNLRAMTRGRLLLVTIGGDFERYRAWEARVGHVRNYAVGQLEDKLAQAGFRIVENVRWGWPFYTPLARSLQNFGKTGTGGFSWATRLVAWVFYVLYFLNSSRRGDILVVLAAPSDSPA